MRRKVLDDTGGYGYEIIDSLAGLDSDRAWDMREEVLKHFNVDDYEIIDSLAGLDSDRAWTMREECFKDAAAGDYVAGFIAKGLAGLDSDRAWKMRDEAIRYAGANKSSIAQGLAGLDSARAWKMRDELIQSGVDKDYIALGLAGNYITFVWQLRKKEFQAPKEIERKLKLLNILNELVPVQIEVEETERQPEKREKTKFKVGDKVIGKKSANDVYRVTKQGWVGEVVDVQEGGLFLASDDGGRTFPLLLEEDFDLLKSAEGEINGENIIEPTIENNEKETKYLTEEKDIG